MVVSSAYAYCVLYAMILFDIGYYFLLQKQMDAMAYDNFSRTYGCWICFSLFPSCQIPAAIIVIVLLIACLVRDRDKMLFSVKEWYRIALPVAFVGASGVYFV